MYIFNLFLYTLQNSLQTTNENSKQNLTIQNGDRELTFSTQPTKLVTLRQHITETALDLDLDKYIIGASQGLFPPANSRTFTSKI